jgi:hypothetical protein
MNTIEYMAAVKSRLQIQSDFALSKALGVTRQCVSRYMKGHSHFDEAVSRRVAEILDIHAGLVMLDMQRERAIGDESRNLWAEISAGFPALLLHANRALKIFPAR